MKMEVVWSILGSETQVMVAWLADMGEGNNRIVGWHAFMKRLVHFLYFMHETTEAFRNRNAF